jgi:hypothetical protein
VKNLTTECQWPRSFVALNRPRTQEACPRILVEPTRSPVAAEWRRSRYRTMRRGRPAQAERNSTRSSVSTWCRNDIAAHQVAPTLAPGSPKVPNHPTIPAYGGSPGAERVYSGHRTCDSRAGLPATASYSCRLGLRLGHPRDACCRDADRVRLRSVVQKALSRRTGIPEPWHHGRR